MRILVTGVSGQLGHDIVMELNKETGNTIRGVSREDFDLLNETAVKEYVRKFQPNAIIHCAAYTAVDKAESDQERCRAVNALGTQYLAEAAKKIGAKFLYVSTDYVFDGKLDRPYEINDVPNPLNMYGRTKLEGENAVRRCLEQYFIVRTSWVFGSNGGNFVKTMLRLGRDCGEVSVVSDQYGSPTYTKDLAALLTSIIRTEKYGVYHATNEGYCTWYDFAKTIFEMSGLDISLNAIPSADYQAMAPRPNNSRLSKKSLTDAGFGLLPVWQDALGRFMFTDRDI